MSFFGNLFKSKTCAICMQKMGMTEQKELADGNFICNKCADKLSDWFPTEARKKATPKQISDQILERAKNEMAVIKFETSRVIGKKTKVYIDEKNRKFMVSDANDLRADNPDVLDASCILNVQVDIDETKHELYDKDAEGRSISYNPRRYDFVYDFYVTIDVQHPYCSHRRFKVNDSSIWVRYDYLQSRGLVSFNGYGNSNFNANGGSFAQSLLGAVVQGVANSMGAGVNNPTGMYPPEYNECLQIAEDMKRSLLNLRNANTMAMNNAYANPAMDNGMGTVGGIAGQMPQQPIQPQSMPQQPSKQWFCPNCGAPNNTNFCQNCGTKKPF